MNCLMSDSLTLQNKDYESSTWNNMTWPQMTWVVRTSFFSFGCRFEPSLKFFIVGVSSAPWLVKWKQLDNLYKHSETEEMRKKKLRVKINQNRDFFIFAKSWNLIGWFLIGQTERFIISIFPHFCHFFRGYTLYFFLPKLGRSIHGRGPTTQTGSRYRRIHEISRFYPF